MRSYVCGSLKSYLKKLLRLNQISGKRSGNCKAVYYYNAAAFPRDRHRKKRLEVDFGIVHFKD